MEIEVDQALQRLADNKALYVNLALRFPKDVAEMMSLFRHHLALGEHVAAAAVLHGLKGTASTVGARALAEQAAGLESRLKNVDLPADARQVESQCVALEAVLGEALAALDGVVAKLRPPPQNPADAGFDATELKGMLVELAALLESRNMRALSFFAKVQYKFGAISTLQASPGLGALADAMNRLDFDAALKSCRLFAAELD